MNIKDLENKIINADCLDILKELPDKSIDLVFTDVPYKQEFRGGRMCKERPNYQKISDYGSNKEIDYQEYFDLILKKLKKVNVFTFCDKETKFDFISMAKQRGFGYKELCFCKSSPTPFVNNQWLPDVEFGLHIFKDLEVMGDYSTKRSFFIMPNFREETSDHPTAKKISIITQILKNISKEEDLVLDTFAGSCPVAFSCDKLKRRFICIEKDKNYFSDSLERFKIYKKQLKLF